MIVKFMSLFAGIGGFDLGFERVGMVCDSVVEKDKNCQAILRRHFPEAKIFDDVYDIGIATHERKSIKLICGGFPCQDVSIAGRRQGLAGERSGLWFEFARIIDELEPQWVVIENVPGLLSSNKGKDFAIIIQWLAERGYGVAWRILDAQYFGVPQRRRRVFVVGSFGDGCAAEVLFERESSPGDTPPSREKGQGVAHAISASPTATGRLDPNGQDFVPTIASTLTVRQAGYGASGGEDSYPHNHIATYNIQHNDGGDHKRKDRPNGGMYVNETDTALTVGTTDLTAVAYNIMPQNSGKDYKAKETEISQNLTTNGNNSGNQGGTYIASIGVRRLTPTECERLQGFPDGWTDGQSDSTRYRQLGNAVAVPVIEWIGRRIMQNERI